jgi:hypothetical protein
MSSTSTSPKNIPKSPQQPQWFNQILRYGDKQIGLYLIGLKSLCERLIALGKLISIVMLILTILYALLVWRHSPSSGPRELMVGWALCLVLASLGRIALEGQSTARVALPLCLLVIFYWLPVYQISRLIQNF